MSWIPCDSTYPVRMTRTDERHQNAGGWVPDDSTFGARLALVRQRMGWGNVKEAAMACQLPTESWRTWERDGVMPRALVEVAEKIAERTGADFGWLLAGSRLTEGRVVTVAGARKVHAADSRQTLNARLE